MLNSYEDVALNAVRFYKAANVIGQLKKCLPDDDCHLLVTAAKETAALLAQTRTPKTVLDFGGGFGLMYFFLGRFARLERWAVVETPIVAAMGKVLETDNLKFFSSIKAASEWLGEVDLLYSNSAIQYTVDPAVTLKDLLDVRPREVMLVRCAIGECASLEWQESFLSSNGVGPLPPGVADLGVRYLKRTISRGYFGNIMLGYTLVKTIGAEHFLYRSQV